MQRRSFIATVGILSSASLSGCLDALSGDGEEDFETGQYDGREVPLAPLETVYEWFEADDARFVDTRGPGQYETAHIEGAVSSPPTDDATLENDPVSEWGTDTRIVTYCDCPHSLAVMRASQYKEAGYDRVYALDDGFPAWKDAEYPVVEDETAALEGHEIVGESDPANAGAYVWLTTADGRQTEITQVEDDGTFTLLVRFADIDEDTRLSLEGPDHEYEATLETLTTERVRA